MTCKIVEGIEFHDIEIGNPELIVMFEEEEEKEETSESLEFLQTLDGKLGIQYPVLECTDGVGGESGELVEEIDSNFQKITRQHCEINNIKEKKDIEYEEENSSIKKKKRNWLNTFVNHLSRWLISYQNQVPSSITTNSDHESLINPGEEIKEEKQLWEDWEWIVSNAEKFAMRRSVEEAQEIKEELSRLRESANLLKSRVIFLTQAKLVLEQRNEEEVKTIKETILDSSKRSKIISDVVNHYAENWYCFIEQLFFQETTEEVRTSFNQGYLEYPYQKGIIGGMKESGWQASHGPGTCGLTSHILGDITWAFWKRLISSIRFTLERELVKEEMQSVAEKICECQTMLVTLWYTTVKNSEFGSAREGRLPKIWAKEDADERQRLEEIKKQGTSARYEYKPVVIQASERKQLGELRKLLESSLVFRLSNNT